MILTHIKIQIFQLNNSCIAIAMKTMKTTSAILLAVFLSAFTSTTSATAIVVDSNGNPVRNGGEYFMGPTNGGLISGGLVRRGSSSNNCSLGVVRQSGGWRLTISSPLETPYISENNPLNISVTQSPLPCAKSSDYIVIKSSPIREPVMVGTDEDFPGSVVDGYFAAASVDSSRRLYKLIFCHTVGECGNIGLVFDLNNLERLHVTVDEPLVFQFLSPWNFDQESSNPKLSVVV